MRIAIVGNFGLTGKQTMAVRALPLAESLAARGHQVAMALPARTAGDRPGRLERNGVQIETIGPGMPIPGLSFVYQVARLLLACLSWKPDAVYCFKPIAHSWAVLALLGLLRGLRLFRGRLVLDTDDWEGYGGWNDVQPFPGWLKRVIAWQELWSLRHADKITVASKALLEMVRKAVGREAVYLPNAVMADSLASVASVDGQEPTDGDEVTDRDESMDGDEVTALKGRVKPPAVNPALQGCDTPLPSAIEADDSSDAGATSTAGASPDAGAAFPIVLVYTRFVEFTPERLLDTFQSIRHKVAGASLLVVGTGLNGEESLLQRLAAQRGLSDRITMAGWVAPEKLPSYLAASDVALYLMDDTLLNRTKCPMKLVELLAAGVPVVADRVGQAGEYISDGRTGLLVSPGHVEAMASAAAALLVDPARRSEIAAAARADVRERWSWAVWAEVAEESLRRQPAPRAPA